MKALVLLFGMIALSPQAFAARAGTIDLPEAYLRAGPGESFQILQRLPKGEKVVASNLPIEGYYKVRKSDGTLGFVPASALVLEEIPGVSRNLASSDKPVSFYGNEEQGDRSKKMPPLFRRAGR